MATCTFTTSLGPCELHFDGDQVTGFRLPGEAPSSGLPPGECPPWIAHLVARVQRHLRGEAQDFAGEPYAWAQVTSFQRSVYEAALAIKSGHTATYGDLAKRLGYPVSASRAVGVALGQNPWPLLVPCHRLVGAGGRMTGFSAPGGVKTKLWLLAIEGSELIADA